jgi:heat shock protein HslJ
MHLQKELSMTRLALAAALSMTACVSPALSADPAMRGPWQLTLIDDTDFPTFATLWFDANGNLGGKAPCNGWTARNIAALPELKLSGITATEMACDALADETRFFETLSVMETATLTNTDQLTLQGPGGRRMMFSRLIVIQDN